MILTAGLQLLSNLLSAPLCRTFHLSDSLSDGSIAMPSLLSLPYERKERERDRERVRERERVCQPLQGPLLEISTAFGLGFVIQGWTVDPGEDRE